MAGSCNVASGSLVDVDIPELSESPWPGVGIYHTSMGLGRRMGKELDLKLTLGMAERRYKLVCLFVLKFIAPTMSSCTLQSFNK